MNGDASAHNHKDFLDAFFQQEQPPSHNQSSIDSSDIFQTASASSSGHHSSLGNMQQQSMSNNGLGMDVLEGLMGMQERGGQSGMSSGAQPTPQMLVEQQMRLNQLQQLYQLQTQIFQQQIELLSGQTSFSSLSGTPREQQQYLPTPAQSTELPPQPSPDFVPPMLLQSTEHNVGNMGHHTQHHFIPHQIIPTAPHSAPANIVFQNIQSPYPLPSPAELDFDEMSPLTSPWLGAYNTNQPTTNANTRSMPSSSAGTKRRTASPSSDELPSTTGRPSRKRQAAHNRIPQNVPSLQGKKPNLRGTKSANSTPLFPATSNQGGSSGRRGGPSPLDIPGDTPSPVDLSMPPPATPQPLAPMNFLHEGLSSENASAPTPMPQEHITPVTPASIMNIGRSSHNISAPSTQSAQSQRRSQDRQSKPPRRPRSATVTSVPPPSGTKTAASLVSPGLKPILPAGNISGSMSPTGPLPQPTLQVRKTSHKAAEQKRRDSLKTSFDDLRLLLPPIPLPSEEGYPDEPILPGAMPPRGPPKGNADGPNRGVSKLQLLRCGNDYLRRLKGRVERRDDEIDKLRKEIRRLRIVVGSEYMQTEEEGDGQEPIDLEKDLDAEESSLGPLGRYPGTLYEGDEGDDDGAD